MRLFDNEHTPSGQVLRANHRNRFSNGLGARAFPNPACPLAPRMRGSFSVAAGWNLDCTAARGNAVHIQNSGAARIYRIGSRSGYPLNWSAGLSWPVRNGWIAAPLIQWRAPNPPQVPLRSPLCLRPASNTGRPFCGSPSSF